ALLAAILAQDIEDVLPVLAHARDAAVLVEDPEEPSFLRFRHALTRQVIYDDLLVFDKQRLHSRILETLERDGDADGSRLYALAEHAAAAHDAPRTLRYGERAGNAAWALGAFTEAIACFERALDAATDDGDRARLLELLAFPVTYGGDLRRAVQLWEEALAIRMRRAEYVDAARLHQEIICERFHLGDIPDEGEAALALVTEHARHIRRLTRDSVHALVACVRSELCHTETVESLFARIEDAESLPSLTLQNVVRANLHRAAYEGRVDEWREQLARLMRLAPFHENRSVDAYNIVDSLASAVTCGLHLNVHRELEEALGRGKEIVSEWGFERYVHYYDALDAAYRFTRGRLSSARALATSASVDSGYLTSALVARTAPLLALALDDDSL
ncbi:MAG: hypothetical protein IAI49_13610, partial [Candidatus Eremiobacteraeota bacterium]|nr:hypothetical protein [Candidatus Eremiobacteraeota bacterium]